MRRAEAIGFAIEKLGEVIPDDFDRGEIAIQAIRLVDTFDDDNDVDPANLEALTTAIGIGFHLGRMTGPSEPGFKLT